ncbi:RNA polymerase sigma factor SigZ [Alkalicoccus halolimnae]|uniref:RNA polymerase sigma factor SigZ n=1 Tax=Alkalicoccus halolimnae TaxID=1667239 RepID=A0A5C7F2F1_9BACI|nr:RNA polymerase sigma factor SigZ [Alkalicoccus halolimnae]TXF82770.1 RNA polymerase sigma factor SigZ [Alkalicoccus halolimnae]
MRQVDHFWEDVHDRLLKMIQSKVSNREDAKDILHNVYIKMQERIDQLRDEEKLESWLFQLTRNTIIDYYRVRRLHAPLEEEELLEETDDPMENYNPEVAAALARYLTQLPPEYEEALRLYDIEGWKHKQIAEHLGISISGSKTRVQRGRQKLKKLLLDCCAVKLDAYGNAIDYYKNPPNMRP